MTLKLKDSRRDAWFFNSKKKKTELTRSWEDKNRCSWRKLSKKVWAVLIKNWLLKVWETQVPTADLEMIQTCNCSLSTPITLWSICCQAKPCKQSQTLKCLSKLQKNNSSTPTSSSRPTNLPTINRCPCRTPSLKPKTTKLVTTSVKSTDLLEETLTT